MLPIPSMSDWAAREQDITTEVGATYTLEFDIYRVLLLWCLSAATSGAFDMGYGAYETGSNHTSDFVATSTTTYIGFMSTIRTYQYFDNVSCKKQNTPGALEITTTYTEDELRSLKFAQSADTLYIVHPSHAPAKLTRTSHTTWTLTTITFEPYATYEAEYRSCSDTYSCSSHRNEYSNGCGWQVCILASDVDREIISGTGRAIITAVVDLPLRSMLIFVLTLSSRSNRIWKLDPKRFTRYRHIHKQNSLSFPFDIHPRCRWIQGCGCWEVSKVCRGDGNNRVVYECDSGKGKGSCRVHRHR